MAARLAMLLGLVTAAAACEPNAAPSAPPPSNLAASPVEGREDLPEEQRSPDLFGAWLIDEVRAPDGIAQDRSWDMILLVGSRQLELLSQCVTIGPFDYGRRRGGILVAQPSASPGAVPPGGLPPPPQCARALSAAEQALPRILFAAPAIRWGAEGSVALAGEPGSLVLRRPTGALANPRGQAPPPPRPPLLGAWRFLSIDGSPVPHPERMELLLRPRHIEWRSGCVNEVRALRVEGDRLLPGAIDPFPICERGRTGAEIAAERLFSGPVATDMRREGRLTLTGSGVKAELAPLVR